MSSHSRKAAKTLQRDLWNKLGLRERGFIHSRRRLRERYALSMNRDEYEEICQEVLKNIGKYCFENRENKTKKVCKYPFKGKIIYFLFDTYFDGVRTIFPPEQFENSALPDS